MSSPRRSPRPYAASPRPTPGPERWIAVNLSVLFPGLGQLYSGAIFQGVLFTAIAICLLIYTGWSLFAAEGHTLRGLISLAMGILLYGISLVDAYRNTNHTAQRQKAPRNPRWYAVLLSQVLPGLGHFYRQQAVLGGVFLGSSVLIAFAANFYPSLLPIPPFIWAIAVYHIYRNVPDSVPQRPMIAVVVLGILATRLTLGYIPVWVNQALVQCIVPSESMAPTLMINDRIFVHRQPGFRPKTGEIVVFAAPTGAIAKTGLDPDTLLVKRVIGLPGQMVQITAGQVLIDQVPLNEPYDPRPATYEWGPAIIPLEAYFVLGDNRDFSADSHVWGVVSRQQLLGPAYKIYWPLGRVQPLALD